MKDIILYIVVFIIGLVAGAGVLSTWNASTAADDQDIRAEEQGVGSDVPTEKTPEQVVVTENQVTTIPSEGETFVSVTGQAAGDSVLVEEVSLEQSGWIVIHELIEGNMANALGAVRRDAGMHSDVIVPLLRATETGKSYAVVLYADNGNGVFDINADVPVVDQFGEAAIAEFITR